MLVAGLVAATTLAGCGDSKVRNTDGGADGGTDGADAASDGPVLTTRQLRGKYLVDSVIACGDCHTPRGPMGPDMSKYLAGNPNFIVTPGGDKLPSRNLTNDATGLKNLTDDEIKAMFMDGLRPTAVAGGTAPLNPVMPYYIFHNMKMEDADAIVAYLRVVPGVENEIPKRTTLFDVPAPAPALDLTKVPAPASTLSAADKASALRGQYLATQSGVCVECHTKHLPPGSPTILDEAHLFEGGEDFSAFFADTLMIKPVSKNLTSDMATGLGEWTADDIVKVLKEGKAKDGSGVCPPMPVGPMAAYGHLKAEDAMDIANYIKSLPPKVNMIVDMCMFPPMMPGADAGADAAVNVGTDASTDGAPAN